MPNDLLLTLYRAAALSASVNGDAKFIGANRGGTVVARVGGDVTGTNPTLDWKVQESSDGVSSWADIATGTQIIDEMVGYVATATPRYEVPGEDPLFLGFKTTKDFIRIVITLGGTTPVFNVVSFEVEPNALAFVRSGR